jgi:dienelactone hydrolase
MRAPLLSTIAVLALVAAANAQNVPPGPHDEARIPAYTLPDPLTMQDGTAVTTPAQWRDRRRPELLALFAREVYGSTPAGTLPVSVQVTEPDTPSLGGLAVRRQVTLTFGTGPRAVAARLLMYVPTRAKGPAPAFVALNFDGNHAIDADPGITVSPAWMEEGPGVVDHRATEAARGTNAAAWPLARIAARGYAIVTAYYGDFDPDFDDGFQNGVQPLFYRAGQSRPGPSEWGAIGAWSWGLSRMLDYLETERAIDVRRVAVLGHSRLGKAALWAAAQDQRFAMAVSNESGCGGAALSKRIFGEVVKDINVRFPHWFATTFRRYNDREADLPVDQHELLALIAPRPLYVASAADDLWADPKGEFLGALHAEPVYRLLGRKGLGVDGWPPPDTPVGDTIGYHVRRGDHALATYDWERYMDFADRHLASTR